MDRPKKIKVLIVDDHTMVRQGLQIMLEAFNEFEVVGDTGDGRIAMSMCNQYQPDVVLMDLYMPRMDGIATTRLIRNRFSDIGVVALTASTDEETIRSALIAGVNGYLLKTGSIEEIANAVRDVYQGKPAFASEALTVLISNSKNPKRLGLGHDLTKQERKVLALVVKGLNNRQIAENMFITQSTVKAHVSNIMAKLHTSSRTKVIAIAIQNGLVDTSEA
jgi:two-component system, NarL family, response regulator LiaR